MWEWVKSDVVRVHLMKIIEPFREQRTNSKKEKESFGKNHNDFKE